MSKQLTEDELNTRHEMAEAYNVQKDDRNGWADWGMFTAHVVHGLMNDIAQMRQQLRQRGIDPGPRRDPFQD